MSRNIPSSLYLSVLDFFFYSDGEVVQICLGTISLCFLILQCFSLFDLIIFCYSGGVMVQICGKRLDMVQKKKLFLEGHEDLAVVNYSHFYCP